MNSFQYFHIILPSQLKMKGRAAKGVPESSDLILAVWIQTCCSFWTLKWIFFGPEMTSIHLPRATATIENELLSIASQVHVCGAQIEMSMIVQSLSWHLHFNRQELFQAYRGCFLASWLLGCLAAIWLAGLSEDSMPYAGMVSLPTLISNAEYRVKNKDSEKVTKVTA